LFTTPIISGIRKRRRKEQENAETDSFDTDTESQEEVEFEDASRKDEEAAADEEEENDDDLENFTVREVRNSGNQPKSEKELKEDDVEITVEDSTNKDDDLSNKQAVEVQDYDPTLELPHYKLPPLNLLNDYDSGDNTVTNEELISNKNRIVETLASYKIKIDKIKATIGPTVTLYEIVPAPGIRISKIKNLEDDIALNLSALGIRIIAPIPGKGTIGIEVPNQTPRIVSMKSILGSKKFQESDFELAISLGKTISNETFTFDLAKMPHLLVAGATGQGKSVGLNAIIASLLYKKHPAQLKFVMVDPKKVELSLYSKIENHFLAKLEDTEESIITDTQKVISTLNSLCAEMDARYDLLQMAHVRNIKEYNKKFISRKLNPEKGHRYMPFIVVIIDEFADLIMTAGRSIETPISRLAQLARAIGIHLVIATQRPTTNIITGVIKANFPARIAFRVSSGIDSRTILDGPGADQLIGRGDLLFLSGNEPIRIQCAFIDTPEIEAINDFISKQKGLDGAMELKSVDEPGSESSDVDLKKRDDLFTEAAYLVVQHQQGSTSLIQRKLSLGYNRAGRIVDQLEAAGILGPPEGSKARQVLPKDEFTLEQILKELE
ncbi:DNA translocase FtsK, partial [Bacteroidota bacterium]